MSVELCLLALIALSDAYSEQMQRVDRATADQCACDPSNCQPYDARFAASTLEEAMENFPDLSFSEPRGGALDPRNCGPSGCQADDPCKKSLVERLWQVDMLDDDERDKYYKKWNMGSPPTDIPVDAEERCSKYNMKNNYPPEVRKHGGPERKYHDKKKGKGKKKQTLNRGTDQFFNNLRNQAKDMYQNYRNGKTSSNGQDLHGQFDQGRPEGKSQGRHRNGNGKGRRGPQEFQKDRKRTKRADEVDIGIRHFIQCVKVGQPVEPQSSFFGLCQTCWAWRELPDDFSPKYLNELTCGSEENEGDGTCLSGFASCREITRNVDVNRRIPGTNRYQKYTVRVSSACNCHFNSDSGIAELALGKDRFA